MKNKKIIGYAMDFASFIMEKCPPSAVFDIEQIILFGSVARGTNTPESDVDIFIETKNQELEKIIPKIQEKFLSSRKFLDYWKLMGIEPEISCKIGKLDEWALKRSIISEGIVLYGRYQGKIQGKTYTLFFISIPKKRSQQVKHWRALYGYHQKIGKKTYETAGLIRTLHGKKISAGVVMVPSGAVSELQQYLHKHRIKYHLLEVSTDAAIEA